MHEKQQKFNIKRSREIFKNKKWELVVCWQCSKKLLRGFWLESRFLLSEDNLRRLNWDLYLRFFCDIFGERRHCSEQEGFKQTSAKSVKRFLRPTDDFLFYMSYIASYCDWNYLRMFQQMLKKSSYNWALQVKNLLFCVSLKPRLFKSFRKL